jgi:hypothetical protein
MTAIHGDTVQPTIRDAQTTVRRFLEATLPEVQRVDVTRIATVGTGEAGWEAEADVWQPNPTLQTLGIQTQRPVLDHQHYLLRLDALLNVLAYELNGPGGKER